MPRSSSRATFTSRRRWTPADAQAALSALQASGLSPRAFALSQGLDADRLYRWRRRLGVEPTSRRRATPPPTFVEVKVSPAVPVEVVLRSGRVLRVQQSIDVEVLLRLVEALDPSC